MKKKYVVWGNGVASVFTDNIPHDRMNGPMGFQAVGAGFCDFYLEKGDLVVKCWEKSIGLNVESRPIQDAEIIKSCLLE